MGANELRVYCTQLAHASEATTGAANEIDSMRRSLAMQMDSLARTWTGQAAAAYLNVWADIDDECGAMLTDLRWIGESLSAAAAAYAQMEDVGANAFRAIEPPARGQ